MEVEINEAEQSAMVEVSEDQQSLAIGRGGQNVRLAAKLTGWKIDIKSMRGVELAHADAAPVEAPIKEDAPAEVTPEKVETPVEEPVAEVKSEE